MICASTWWVNKDMVNFLHTIARELKSNFFVSIINLQLNDIWHQLGPPCPVCVAEVKTKEKFLKKWKFEFVIFVFVSPVVRLWLCELDWIEGNPHSNLRFVFSERTTQRTATSLLLYFVRNALALSSRLIWISPTIDCFPTPRHKLIWVVSRDDDKKISTNSQRRAQIGSWGKFSSLQVKFHSWDLQFERRIYELTCISSWVSWTRSSSTVRMNKKSHAILFRFRNFLFIHIVFVSIYGRCLHRSRTMVVSRRRPTGSSCGRAIKREFKVFVRKFKFESSWKKSFQLVDLRGCARLWRASITPLELNSRELDCLTLEKVSQASPSGRRLLFNSSSKKLSEISHVFFENVPMNSHTARRKRWKLKLNCYKIQSHRAHPFRWPSSATTHRHH